MSARSSSSRGKGRADEQGSLDVKGKGQARMADEWGADAPPARPPFSTNLSSPIDASTAPIPPRIHRSHTSNTLNVPPSPSVSLTSSHHASGSGSGSATPRFAGFARHSVRAAVAKPLDLKAEFDEQERERVARGSEKKKGKGKEKETVQEKQELGAGTGGAAGLGRKKSTMMLGGLSKGLSRMGSVMRKTETGGGPSSDAASASGQSSNRRPSDSPSSASAPGSVSTPKGKLGVLGDSPGSLSLTNRHLPLNGSGSLRSTSASVEGSLLGRGAPSESMGSVREDEEDDASVQSFAQGETAVRAPSASASALSHTHKRMGSQGSVMSLLRPKISGEQQRGQAQGSGQGHGQGQGKNRRGEDEGDAGITMPFATKKHDLHVSPELHDLPPAWLQTLKEQGMSEGDLLLIAAARRKQLMAREKVAGSRRTHSNHGSFSGSISELSQSHVLGDDDSPKQKITAIKASRSLPRLSGSGSCVSHSSNGSTDTHTTRTHGSSTASALGGGATDSVSRRRSWLAKPRSRGKVIPPIAGHRDGPTPSGLASGSRSQTRLNALYPTFDTGMRARKQSQEGGALPRLEDEVKKTDKEDVDDKRRLSDQLRGFASLNLMSDDDASWAEGVLGLMQNGTSVVEADSGVQSAASPDTRSMTRGEAVGIAENKPLEGSGSGVAAVAADGQRAAPTFRMRVDGAEMTDQPDLTSAVEYSGETVEEEDEQPLSREGHTDASYYAAMSLRNRNKASSLVSPDLPSSARSTSPISRESDGPGRRPRSPDRSAVTPAHTHHQLAPDPSAPVSVDEAHDRRRRIASPVSRLIDSPPMRIATPPMDRADRPRTATPDHLRLRKASSTELLSRYGPNPHAPPRSALPSPPEAAFAEGQGRSSPRPPFGYASKGYGTGAVLLGTGVGKPASHMRPRTAPKEIHLRQPEVDSGSTSDSGLPTGYRERQKKKKGHRHAESMETADSAELVTPSGTDEGRTPRPGEKGFVAASKGPAPPAQAVHRERNIPSRMRDYNRDSSPLRSDSDEHDDLRRPSRHSFGFPASMSPPPGMAGAMSMIGLGMRSDPPQRLAMRSRRNTQSSLPASAADTDELFMRDEIDFDADMPSAPGITQRNGTTSVERSPLSTGTDGESAASPRMSLKTYMFEPESDDNENEAPSRDEMMPGLLGAGAKAATGMTPGKEHGAMLGNVNGQGTFRLSLYYRTPPQESPETPPDAPMTDDDVQPVSYTLVGKHKHRVSGSRIARPLSFSAPYDSLHAANAQGNGQLSSQRPDNNGDGKLGDTLSPLPPTQDSKDRSRRSSRAFRASRLSRRSRASLQSGISPSPTPTPPNTDQRLDSENAIGESSSTLVNSLTGTRRDKRISALSAFSSRSAISGVSSWADSDSDLHDLRDLDDLDEDDDDDGIGAGARGMGVVREARMTHVGAAPGRASIFALNGLGLGEKVRDDADPQ